MSVTNETSCIASVRMTVYLGLRVMELCLLDSPRYPRSRRGGCRVTHGSLGTDHERRDQDTINVPGDHIRNVNC